MRKSFDLPDTVKALSFYLSDLFFRLDLPCQPRDEPEGVSLNEYMHCKDDRSQEIMAHAEPQLFLYDLLLMKLIDDGDLKNAKEFGVSGLTKSTLPYKSKQNLLDNSTDLRVSLQSTAPQDRERSICELIPCTTTSTRTPTARREFVYTTPSWYNQKKA